MTISLPSDVREILNTLHTAGYEAYAVGGCVRDSLLGRVPGDWDITTSALPQEVKQRFRRCIDTGIQHGTVTVMMGKNAYEVTTYRVDGDYEDHRHPREVTFSRSLVEDMQRRDFTINAMAYNEEDGLVDHFGGLEDLHNRLIRCVGDPAARFSEDALRILRAVRFAAQLDFDIDGATAAACRELAPTLSRISAERIRTELHKLLISDHPERILTAAEYGITAVVLPEFDTMLATPQNTPHHLYDVGHHTVKALTLSRPDPILRWALLLHDVGKPLSKTTDDKGIDHFKGHDVTGAKLAEEILRRLKWDNEMIRRVTNLVRYHDERYEPTLRNVRRAIHRVGDADFLLLQDICTADVMAQSDYHRQDKLDRLAGIRACYEQIQAAGDCLTLRDLAVKGEDLRAAGVAPGPEMGLILKRMLEACLDDPTLNHRDLLLSRLQEFRTEKR
ncbi:MAG: CCA tRNA nucleotidyltransferase [Butyrivibrio sp.]|nr:CCA tRNA nucleotidyltransferase [Butyrivibrio sp.]